MSDSGLKPKKRIKRANKSVKKPKSRQLPNSGILMGLSSGTLNSNLLRGVIRYPHPDFYELLWELSWKADKTCDLSLLQKALLHCRWDDPRSTTTLTELARLNPEGPTGGSLIKLLQRRGGFEVFQCAAELTKSEKLSDQLLGIRILGDLEGPWCPLRNWIFRTLLGLLANKDPKVIAMALETIMKWSDQDLSEIVPQLQSHTDDDIRSACQVILYGFETTQSFEGLLALITGRQEIVRKTVFEHIRATILTGPPLDSDDSNAEKIAKSASHSTRKTTPLRARKSRRNSILSYPGATHRQKVGLGAILAVVVLAYPVNHFAKSLFVNTHPLAWVAGKSKVPPPPPSAPWKSFSNNELETLIQGDNLEGSNLMMASRITRWIRLKNRPVRWLLNNSRESWIIYNSMHPQLGAFIVSKASPPTTKSNDERLNFRHVVRSLVMDINNGFYGHAAVFMQYLAEFNGTLASYLLVQLSESNQTIQFFLDDFLIEMATLTKSAKARAAINPKTGFHSAIDNLTPQARNRLAESLSSGWVSDRERSLSTYLLSF